MKVRDADYDIRDYFKEVKHLYPNLTLKDFEKICKSPFSFFRKHIESNNFPVILIKYLGKLIPFRDYKEKQNEQAKKAFEKQAQAKGHHSLSTRESEILPMVSQEPQGQITNQATHQGTNHTPDTGVDG